MGAKAGFHPRPEGKQETRYPLRENGFLWSCYPDLNRRPHPYQLIGRMRSHAFGTFCALFRPVSHALRHSCVHCFRPLVSPCGSACGSSQITRQGMARYRTAASQDAVPCPSHRCSWSSVRLSQGSDSLPSQIQLAKNTRTLLHNQYTMVFNFYNHPSHYASINYSEIAPSLTKR